MPAEAKAVFIDGDFWHGRDYERILTSRGKGDYWPEKIAGNVKRDRCQRSALRRDGWRVIKVWESDLKRKKTQARQLEKIERFLNN